MTSTLPVAVGELSEKVIEALLDELRYAGWVGVDDDLEWHPDVTAIPHSFALFADAIVGLDLDPTPNAHIDSCTGPAFAVTNLVTLGAMQCRRRGVVLGQLS